MPELKPLQKYVYEKNELDEKVEKLEKRINDLKLEYDRLKDILSLQPTASDQVDKITEKYKDQLTPGQVGEA